MLTGEFRSLSIQELQDKVKELQNSYTLLCYQHSSSALASPSEIRHKRREIARAKTVLREKINAQLVEKVKDKTLTQYNARQFLKENHKNLATNLKKLKVIIKTYSGRSPIA